MRIINFARRHAVDAATGAVLGLVVSTAGPAAVAVSGALLAVAVVAVAIKRK